MSASPTAITPGILTLADLKVQQHALIVALDPDPKDAGKLLALGVLPGMQVTLLQKQPSIVFAVGYSQFAVDHVLARKIQVTPL